MHRESPTNAYLRTVGQKLKFHRSQKGIRQEDIALLLGVDVNTVQRYESGEISLSLRKATKFAQLVGMPSEELYDKSGNSQ